MLKKTITYTDYNGVERKEDFYFNLSKAEITEMEFGVAGGLSEMLAKIIATQDGPKIAEFFKTLILKSYGEKSADGRRFIKNKELTDAFEQTEAYSNLYVELATNSDSAAKFVNGIIPSEWAKKMSSPEAKHAMKELEDRMPKLPSSED